MKIVFLNRCSRFFSETVILNSCLRNRCFVSSLETVFRNSMFPKTVLPFLLRNGVPKIGVAKLVLYLLSKKRCYEIGVTVSSLKRWSRKSVSPNLVVSKTVLRNRCFQKRCYRFFFKTVFPKRYYEIGVTVSSLKRWSRKSVLPNLVVSSRSYEIGALVSLLKRDPNFVFLNSVFRFLHENGVPKFGDLNRCYRFFSKTVFPKSVLRNRCSRFLFLKR